MFYKTIRGRKFPITLRNKLNFVVRRWELVGVKESVRHYGGRALGIAPKADTAPVAAPAPVHSADRERYFGFGPDENAVAVESASAKWGLLYERSSETIFRTLMEKLPTAIEDYTFLDLGAGKGFALCLAAEFPFRQAIGVEYSPALAAEAQENLRLYSVQDRKCKDVCCVLADATTYTFPLAPTVLYLYNPFQGKVMDRVIKNLRQSLREHPRDLWVLYPSPWEHRKFKRLAEFEPVDLTWHYAVYRFRGRQ